jgi:5-methylcytosine-specific restriction endonuclease McrA
MSSSRGTNRRAGTPVNEQKLDAVVARARREAAERMQGYREQSLRLHPWVCARCGREFTRANLHELTVHHKDHDHNHNPPDGSNWENLCLYCHDWEHQKYSHLVRGEVADFGRPESKPPPATHTPFAGLKDLLVKKPER